MSGIACELPDMASVTEAIEACIDRLVQARLFETAALLKIVRLNLTAQIHDISDYELEQIAVAISRRKSRKRLSPWPSRRSVTPTKATARMRCR